MQYGRPRAAWVENIKISNKSFLFKVISKNSINLLCFFILLPFIKNKVLSKSK